ncbi:hypothetical protein PAMP_019679 [Pampus punctatissimus]
MGGTERLWLLASLCQVVLLTCEQHSNPVEVEVVFHPFPYTRDPDSYRVTCRTASNHQIITKVREEGQPLWSDGSPYNLTNTMMSLLLANQTDCFALQRNATGPGYFLTPFFCNIPLPFICQYETPLVPALFSFDLVQVTEEQEASTLLPFKSLTMLVPPGAWDKHELPTLDLFLHKISLLAP